MNVVLFSTDIDECASNVSKCGQLCINSPGSYLCDCNHGYLLDIDRTSCKGKNNQKSLHFYSIYLQYSILRNPSHSKLIFVSNISLGQNQYKNFKNSLARSITWQKFVKFVKGLTSTNLSN